MDQIAIPHDGAVAVSRGTVFKAAGVDHGINIPGKIIGKNIVLQRILASLLHTA